MDILLDPHAWLSLGTLTFLEIVLGIDNLIFISSVIARLPQQQQRVARQLGLGLALLFRIALLSGMTWLAGLTKPLATLAGFTLSWRDFILIGGGLFLMVKATLEIHEMLEPGPGEVPDAKTEMPARRPLLPVICQIIMLDLVFSLDSIITAIGLSRDLPIMIAAVVIAMLVMLFASKPLSEFIARHPTTKMLALAFLLLIGVALVADGLHFHIPKGYLYFAICFSLFVEALNQWVSRRPGRPDQAG